MHGGLAPEELLAYATGAFCSLTISLSGFGEWASRRNGSRMKETGSVVTIMDAPNALYGEIYRRRVPISSSEALLAPCESNGVLPAAGLKSLLLSSEDLHATKPASLGPFTAYDGRFGNEQSGFSLGLKEFTVLCGPEQPDLTDSENSNAPDVSNHRTYSPLETDASALQPRHMSFKESSVDTTNELTVYALVTNLVFSSSPCLAEEPAEPYCDSLRVKGSRSRSKLLELQDSSWVEHAFVRLTGAPDAAAVTAAITMAAAVMQTQRPGVNAAAGPEGAHAVQGFDRCRVRCNISFVHGEDDDEGGDGDEQSPRSGSVTPRIRSPSACEGVYTLRSLQLPAPSGTAACTRSACVGDDESTAACAGADGDTVLSGRTDTSGSSGDCGICSNISGDDRSSSRSNNGSDQAAAAVQAGGEGEGAGAGLVPLPLPSPAPLTPSLEHPRALPLDSPCCPLAAAPAPSALGPQAGTPRGFQGWSGNPSAEEAVLSWTSEQVVGLAVGAAGRMSTTATSGQSPYTPAPSRGGCHTPRSGTSTSTSISTGTSTSARTTKPLPSPRPTADAPGGRPSAARRLSAWDSGVGTAGSPGRGSFSPTPLNQLAEARSAPPGRLPSLGSPAAAAAELDLDLDLVMASEAAGPVGDGGDIESPGEIGASPISRRRLSVVSCYSVETTASTSLAACRSSWSVLGQRTSRAHRAAGAGARGQHVKLSASSTLRASAAAAPPGVRTAAAASLQLCRRRQAREQALLAQGGGACAETACPGYLRPTIASSAKSVPSGQRLV